MEMNVTIYNHIAFVIMFVLILFAYVYECVKSNGELDSEEVTWVIIVSAIVSGVYSYFWFVFLPITGVVIGLIGLVLALKKLAKALVLATAQKSDEKVEKDD